MTVIVRAQTHRSRHFLISSSLPFSLAIWFCLGLRAEPTPKLTVQEAPIDRGLKAPLSFAPIVKKVAPSVVNIYSTTIVHERSMPNPFLNDPFLRRFFGEDFGQE